MKILKTVVAIDSHIENNFKRNNYKIDILNELSIYQ